TIQHLEVLGTGHDGRVPRVRVMGASGTMVMSAYDFRLAVDPSALRSAFFTVETRPEVYHFRGRGWGHGVGLCQWGARGQALAGRNCVEILRFYYPGSSLVAVK
ncbi:MAG: hypothetical protein ACOC46_01530, partial [Pirellulales bacterium]